jgi:hypothetical protein
MAALFTGGLFSLGLLANIGQKKRSENKRQSEIENSNKVLYHSLYEPKEGWKTNVNDYCDKGGRDGLLKGRATKNGWQCRVPPKRNGLMKRYYGYCKRGYGQYDYNSIDKYGCSAGHNGGGGVCYSSAGKTCSDVRNKRKAHFRRKKGRDKYQYIGSDITSFDPDIENGLPVIDSVSCDEEKTQFKIDSGDLVKNIPLIEQPVNYYISNKFPHEDHTKIK